jgi:hypothetical protein
MRAALELGKERLALLREVARAEAEIEHVRVGIERKRLTLYKERAAAETERMRVEMRYKKAIAAAVPGDAAPCDNDADASETGGGAGALNLKKAADAGASGGRAAPRCGRQAAQKDAHGAAATVAKAVNANKAAQGDLRAKFVAGEGGGHGARVAVTAKAVPNAFVPAGDAAYAAELPAEAAKVRVCTTCRSALLVSQS